MMIATTIYAIAKKKIESTSHAIIILVAVFVNILVWLFEQLVRIDFEILSISYIITELLDVPLDSIGKALGGRDHTTIMHARDKVANNIKTNKGLKTTVSDLIAMIKKDD